MVTYRKTADDTLTVYRDGQAVGTVRKLITGYWRTNLRGLVGREFILLRAAKRAIEASS
jgi:hypothetical protein